MNTERYIQRMREDMELRRLAESTQGNYERAIRLFLKHAGRRVEALNKRNVRAYSLSLVKQGLQASTFNVHQAAIAVTLNEEMNYLQMPRAKKEKTLPEILSREEVSPLLERCGYLKHKAIFALAYGSGLRRSEICASLRETGRAARTATPYFPKAALKFLGTTEGHTVQITRKADCFLGSRNAPTLFHRPSTFPWKNSSKK